MILLKLLNYDKNRIYPISYIATVSDFNSFKNINMHTDAQLADIQHKIGIVKENHNNKYRFPKEILRILSLREMELLDNLYFLKS